jgi:hypothetical protein
MVPITFTDNDGVVWDVWEVARPHEPFADTADVPTLTRSEQAQNGHLCFLSARGKRQLDGYPRFWSVLSAQALQRLCDMAYPVGHAEIKAVTEGSSAAVSRGDVDDSANRGAVDTS